MKSCDKFRDLFTDYVDGALSGDEKTQVDHHIQQCNECDTVLSRMAALGTRLRQMELVKTSSTFNFVLRSRIRRELESDTFLEKVASIFQTNKIPAFSFSAVALFLLVYVSVDVFSHASGSPDKPISPVASQTITDQNVGPVTPMQAPRQIPDTPRERVNYVMEELQGESRDSEGRFVESIDFHRQWQLDTESEYTQTRTPRILQTSQSTTVTF